MWFLSRICPILLTKLNGFYLVIRVANLLGLKNVGEKDGLNVLLCRIEDMLREFGVETCKEISSARHGSRKENLAL